MPKDVVRTERQIKLRHNPILIPYLDMYLHILLPYFNKIVLHFTSKCICMNSLSYLNFAIACNTDMFCK